MTEPSQLRLVDAHCHLQGGVFDPDREAVLERARAAGVVGFVVNGTSEADWPLVARLARRHADVHACFGLHPWFVADRSPEWVDALRAHLTATPSAVGEIGLDRWVEPRDEAEQEACFRAQWRLGVELKRPMMVHCLRAWGWLEEVLRQEQAAPRGFLLHAYSGSVELVKPLAERGAYFSFCASALYPKRACMREALPHIPSERLLLETDSPEMPRKKDTRNEPMHLNAIARELAALLGRSAGDLAQQTTANAEAFFGPIGR